MAGPDLAKPIDTAQLSRHDPASAIAGWNYGKAPIDAAVEIGRWSGDRCPARRRHFHDEIQISFVLSGRHQFRAGAEIVAADAGQCILIPARVPHAPTAHDQPGTCVVNIYVEEEFCLSAQRHVRIFAMPHAGLRNLHDILRHDILHGGPAPAGYGMNAVAPARENEQIFALLASGLGIADLARRAGSSREGFTRRFGREAGMPPHAHRLIHRLNRARALLRTGMPLAMAAAETGFADQSHMGRHFRRVFGTTPGAYRATWV